MLKKLETSWTLLDNSFVSFRESKFKAESCTLFNSDSLNGKVYEKDELH